MYQVKTQLGYQLNRLIPAVYSLDLPCEAWDLISRAISIGLTLAKRRSCSTLGYVERAGQDCGSGLTVLLALTSVLGGNDIRLGCVSTRDQMKTNHRTSQYISVVSETANQ
jgi:hypothetical protein